MLRPKFQHKLMLAFLMLSSALILLAEPAYARKDNRASSQKAAKQAAPSQPSTPAPAPTPAPAARPSQPARSVSQPTARTQTRSITTSKPASVRPQTQSRVVTKSPTVSTRNQSISTPSRVTTSKPSVTVKNRNVTSNSKPSQTQVSSNSSVTTNRSVSSRTNTVQVQRNTPSVNNRTSISSSLTNRLGSTINSGSTSSSSGNSTRTNITTNRQTTRTITNNSLSRNNTTSNNRREIANSSNRASQPAASPNTRISSELSSHIGDTIGSQPESTTNVLRKDNNSSRTRVVLPFDREPGSTPQNEVRQPAESSKNRISSDISSQIGSRISTRTNSQRRNTRQETNSVTPPSSSEKQPVERANSRSSLDRANTEIGNIIGSERTTSKETKQPAASPNTRENRNSSRIANEIGKRENSPTRQLRQNSIGDLERSSSTIGDSQRLSRDAQHNSVGQAGSRVDRRADRNVERDKSSSDALDLTRITRVAPDTKTAITNDLHVRDSSTSGRRDLRVHRYEPVRPAQIIVRDRPYVRDSYHDYHSYLDYHDRIFRISITPDYYYRVCYDRGSWLSVRYVYPYYQRKYVFVSLGGYWPTNYRYVRYYWYGAHPYQWYGYYPIARQVGNDVNYYYTYNYYSDNNPVGYETSNVTDPIRFDTVTNYSAMQPAETTLADQYFEEAVNSFELGKYDIAIEKFSRAMSLAPDDMILPFAYSQALFAAGRYSESAEVLRSALKKVQPEKEGVFYPRGLYPNDEVLMEQLDRLAIEAENYSFDADLQLLLGYHLLGIGELDQALAPLKNASLDKKNEPAANILLNLLLKIKVNDITSGVESEPEKINEVEPNQGMLQETEPIIINAMNMSFSDSETSALQFETENVNLANTDDKKEMVSETILANDEPSHKKAKEGILIATLFVLAGSTGIGRLLHH